ncbi:MAG: ABC transporter permease subunit, partial [Gammaproteobacteria bacterium]|nr:ABC transporter permease subunit [Gammaproteobacteria bacterium]
MPALQRIDPNLWEASTALGAGNWRTFWKVIVPLSVPGMIAGCILVYAACVTAFVTHTLIGGVRLLYMPLFVFQQALDLQ